jgi:hypothetical protein
MVVRWNELREFGIARGTGFALLGLGAFLLLLSITLAADPTLGRVARQFLAAVPYVFLAGFALMVGSALLRPGDDDDDRRRGRDDPSPTMYDRESTNFVPQDDTRSFDDAQDPPRRAGA